MIELSPPQKKTVAAGLTVLSFALVLAFVLFVGWVLLKFLGFASPALTPVIVGLFLAMLFKPYYEWILGKVRNPSAALALMLLSVLVPSGLVCWFGGAMVVDQISHLLKTAPMIVGRTSEWVNVHYPNAQTFLTEFGAKPDACRSSVR